MAEIDRLEIQIEAQASKANQSLESLAKKLDRISASLSGVNSRGLATMGAGVNKLANAMSNMNANTKTADFSRLARNLSKINEIDTSKFQSTSSAINAMSTSLGRVGSVSQSSVQISEIAKNLSKLGGANVQKAITNIPQLATSLNNLMTTLSRSPQVSQNVIKMTKALANFASQGGKVGTAAKSIDKNLLSTSQNSKKFENVLRKISSVCASLSGTIKNLGRSFLSYNNSVSKATKHTISLAAAIGKFYASAFLLIRAVKALGKSISSSMDFLETVNYFEVAMRQIGDSASSEWSKNGYNSAEAYAESFSERSKQLTEKMTGYSIDPKGNALFTGEKSLGLDPDKVMQYQAVFAQMSNSIGVAEESALNFSKALTMLGADWASLRNITFDQAWEKFASALAGQSRAVRSLGIDITMATLQQYAYKHGLSEAVSEMNQATKAQLRLLAILDQSKVAYGDLANTISSPANQLRLLQQNFANLSRTIGNLFLPVVAKVLPFINGLVIALQRLFQWMGEILGIKMDSFNSSIGGMDDGLSDLVGDSDDLGDSLDGADKEAKKLRNTILGFDKLNVLNAPDKSKEDEAPSMGGSSILDSAIAKALADYEKIWNDAFDRMENKAQEIADSIQAFMKKLFYPMTEAWNTQGKFVMDAWRGALDSIGSLISTIGSDFMTVLSQEKTVKIFEDIFRIVGDIGLIAENLADNFKKAWSENEVGLRILENIRDLFGIIIENIRKAADNTVEWSKNLSFAPLLEAFERFTDSLKPVIDFLSGILTDFFEQVLRPLGEWVITEGLPDLLDVFTAFNDRVDWEGLRQRLSEFWEHLEPFAETVGEGLVLFIEKIAKALAGFIESGAFDKFLTKIEEWMDNVDAEDVADAFGVIASGIIALKVISPILEAISGIGTAMIGIGSAFKGISTIVSGIGKIFSPVVTLFSNLGQVFSLTAGGAGTFAESFGAVFGTVGTAIAGIASVIGGAILAVKNFISMLEEGFSWIKEVLMLVGIAITAVGAVILGAPALVAGIVAGIVAAVATLVVVVKEHWEEIMAFFTETIPNWWNESVIPFFQGIPDWFAEIFENVKNFIVEKWGQIISFLTSLPEKIGDVINKVVEWFSGLPEKIGYALGYVVGTITKWVLEVKNYLGEKIPEIIENVIKWFSELPQKIYNAIVGFLEKAKEWALNVKKIFEEKTKEIIKNVVTFFKELPGKIYGAITDFFGKIKEWASGAIDTVKSTVPNIINSIVNFFTSLPDKLFEIGKNTIQGLIDGIRSMFSSVWGAITDFAGGVVDGFKSALKIHSPSRIMFSLGEFTIEGFENGMQNLFNNVYGTLDKFSFDMKSHLSIDTSDIGEISKNPLKVNYNNMSPYQSSNLSGEINSTSGLIGEIKNGVYEAVMNAMLSSGSNRNDNMPYVINAVLKTEDNEVLARSVEKGRMSRDMRFQPVIT